MSGRMEQQQRQLGAFVDTIILLVLSTKQPLPKISHQCRLVLCRYRRHCAHGATFAGSAVSHAVRNAIFRPAHSFLFNVICRCGAIARIPTYSRIFLNICISNSLRIEPSKRCHSRTIVYRQKKKKKKKKHNEEKNL